MLHVGELRVGTLRAVCRVQTKAEIQALQQIVQLPSSLQLPPSQHPQITSAPHNPPLSAPAQAAVHVVQSSAVQQVPQGATTTHGASMPAAGHTAESAPIAVQTSLAAGPLPKKLEPLVRA